MRITPADAGKTTFMADIAACIWDHPRRCGENHVHGGYCRVYLGSPPQVRGKQKAAALNYLPIGITPAGAGKTRHQSSRVSPVRDHPRRCGENRHPKMKSRECIGSPPQVRGKLLSLLSFDFVSRITPAGAGKTRPKDNLLTAT